MPWKTLLLLLLAAALITEAPAVQSDGQEAVEPTWGAVVKTEPIAPDGTPIQCDLPKSLHQRNTGGSDGAGLCVFTSIEMAASYGNVEPLFGFQAFMKKRPGGGYPQKVDKMIEAYCAEQKCAKPAYLQVEEAGLATVKMAFRTGRPVSITYCYSPSGRYGGARISHMVSLFHCDDKWACVIDNNFPGTYEWMTPEELLKTANCGGGRIWAVILLNPGPPPPPCN